MPQASADRSCSLPWRPIAELPPDVDEILAFAPGNSWQDARGRPCSELIVIAFRGNGGSWLWSHREGSTEIEPTMFCLLDPPDGAPVASR